MEWWKEKYDGRVGMMPNGKARGGKEGDMSSVSRPREQGTAWVPKLKNEPAYSILIISPPIYSHTAFLDDFFWRSFPYNQAEATRVFRTCGESSPLSKETSRVCAQKAPASSGVCQTLAVCERSHLEMKGEEMLWRQASNLFY